jgi:hypothetical protein
MTDKELLELAAKTAGLEVVTPTMLAHGQWDPLTDDGDALRLAVKLRMHVSIFADAIGIGTPGVGYTETKWINDANVATRRAITRAAAEIGKAKCE